MRMKELVEVIAKALVEHPDEVVVKERNEGRVVKIDLYVAPQDMGKVIGRKGRIAKSIRSVVKAAAAREDCIVDVNIDSKDFLEEDEAQAKSQAEEELNNEASEEE